MLDTRRWNSQEIQQYLLDVPAPEHGHIDWRELTMIRDYILLPHLLTMVQRNLDGLKYADMTLKPLYVSVTELLMERITKDQRRLKGQLAKRSIRLSGDPEYNDPVYAYTYLCRGYEHVFRIVRDVMAVQVRLMLTEYLSGVYQEVAGGIKS